MNIQCYKNDGVYYETRELPMYDGDLLVYALYNFHCDECHIEFSDGYCTHFNPLDHPWKPQLVYLPPLFEE